MNTQVLTKPEPTYEFTAQLTETELSALETFLRRLGIQDINNLSDPTKPAQRDAMHSALLEIEKSTELAALVELH